MEVKLLPVVSSWQASARAEEAPEMCQDLAYIQDQLPSPPGGMVLANLEHEVKSHLNSWLPAGLALDEIKSRKLYVSTGMNWEIYCKKRFGFTPQYANRLIRACKTRNVFRNFYNLRGMGSDFEKLPQTIDFWVKVSRLPEEDRDEVVGRCIEKGEGEHRVLRAADVKAIHKEMIEEIHSTDPDDDDADEGGEDFADCEAEEDAVSVDIPGIVAAIRDGAEITEMLPLDEATRATLGAELGKNLLAVREEEQRLVAAIQTLGVPVPSKTTSFKERILTFVQKLAS